MTHLVDLRGSQLHTPGHLAHLPTAAQHLGDFFNLEVEEI